MFTLCVARSIYRLLVEHQTKMTGNRSHEILDPLLVVHQTKKSGHTVSCSTVHIEYRLLVANKTTNTVDRYHGLYFSYFWNILEAFLKYLEYFKISFGSFKVLDVLLMYFRYFSITRYTFEALLKYTLFTWGIFEVLYVSCAAVIYLYNYLLQQKQNKFFNKTVW